MQQTHALEALRRAATPCKLFPALHPLPSHATGACTEGAVPRHRYASPPQPFILFPTCLALPQAHALEALRRAATPRSTTEELNTPAMRGSSEKGIEAAKSGAWRLGLILPLTGCKTACHIQHPPLCRSHATGSTPFYETLVSIAKWLNHLQSIWCLTKQKNGRLRF